MSSVTLTGKSRKRVVYLYSAFLIILLFNMYSFYLGVSVMLEDPTLPTFPSKSFFVALFTEGPWSRLVVIFCVYIMICLYLCSGDVILRAFLHVFNINPGKYLPIKLRRRSWCFCQCSYQSLDKILRNIYNTQCDWTSLNAMNVDHTTKACIETIRTKTIETFHSRSFSYSMVGSSAEGLGKPYTLQLQDGYRDDLTRFLLRFFCICLPCGTSYSSLRTDIDVILICTDRKLKDFVPKQVPGKPGFVYLGLESHNLNNPWLNLCHGSIGEVALSSIAVRQAIMEVVNQTPESELPASRIFGLLKHPTVVELAETGPAVKICYFPLGQFWYLNENQKFVTFEGHIVFAIHCFNDWPDCARGWIKRTRWWPDETAVNHVLENGYMLVPKSSKTDSSTESIEWCISFSHSETSLSHLIPKVAKACFLALKMILKDHLVYHCTDIKTYHIKTIVYWELEKYPPSYWNVNNIENCFENLLDSLISHVKKHRCPSYWIEGLDLFNVCSLDELLKLQKILLKIQMNPGLYIDNIGSMWC